MAPPLPAIRSDLGLPAISMIGQPSGNTTQPIGKAYWICQFAGWSVLFLVGWLSLAVVRPTNPPSTARIAIGTALVCYGGLAVSHLVYLQIRRRRWLLMPLRQAWPRLVLIILLAAVVVAGISVLASIFIARTVSAAHILQPGVLLLVMLNYSAILAVWMAFYLAIHEFRRRRVAEVQTLLLELVAQEAQLRGLRAQLNPHFLFNCLNSLRELIVEDPVRAQTMVTQISGLLRYSLQSDQTEQVSLNEEVSTVKDYLALEGIRFEERLRIHWNIAAESTGVPVPPMLLQTLVENALKHGIARRPNGGEVSIEARVHDGQLELQVINSGRLSEQPLPTGIGLRNARARLRLLYGDQARLTLADAGPDQVRAAIVIPVKRTGETE